MFGWSRTIGSAPFFGFWPLRIAGTATVVEAETVVVLRYQVELAASLAKFGKRFASIPPSACCRSITGNSSRSRKTIGVVAWVRIAAASAVPLEITSFEVGEWSRNRARKTSGAAASTVRNERAGRQPPRRPARVASPISDGADDQRRRAVDARALQHLDAEDRAEEAEEDEVERRSRAAALTAPTTNSIAEQHERRART